MVPPEFLKSDEHGKIGKQVDRKLMLVDRKLIPGRMHH